MGKKYIHFDSKTGELLGRYDSDFNSDVPMDAVEVTYEVFFQTIDESEGTWKRDKKTGKLFRELPPAPTLESVKASKLFEISNAADAAMRSRSSYPQGESATFTQQVAEAQAYTANDKAPTPLLTAISKARGGGKKVGDIAKKVLEKHAAHSAAVGKIIGQRQAYEDNVDACKTIDAVKEIKIGKDGFGV
jgi:hypothetical protein